MGGSRRRLKKTTAKVKVGVVKRKKNLKSAKPIELVEGRQDIAERLDTQPDWQEEATLTENYNANKLVVDPNESYGRNSRELPLKSKEEREALGEATYSDDDELRAGCGVVRKSGKALPARLTPTQRKLIERLTQRHGTDTEAMMRDRKLNPMQHSVGRLKAMLDSFQFWTEDDRHDFRAPVKMPKRIM